MLPQLQLLIIGDRGMANRSIQQKILKIKRGFGRKKRYAKFSGSTVKYAKGDRVKEVSYLEHIDEDKVMVKTKTVFVGIESFSKQTINTGRGPNRERMQNYYDHVPTSFEPRALAEVLGLVKDSRYAQVWWDTPATNRINLFVDPNNRLDLYTHGGKSFFVELDFVKRIIKRSRDYS